MLSCQPETKVSLCCKPNTWRKTSANITEQCLESPAHEFWQIAYYPVNNESQLSKDKICFLPNRGFSFWNILIGQKLLNTPAVTDMQHSASSYYVTHVNTPIQCYPLKLQYRGRRVRKRALHQCLCNPCLVTLVFYGNVTFKKILAGLCTTFKYII